MPEGPLARQVPRSPSLIARYEARRLDVLRSLERMKPPACFDEERFASLLHGVHRLAGVAGLFGAGRLGEILANAEQALRHAPAAKRAALIEELKAELAVESKLPVEDEQRR